MPNLLKQWARGKKRAGQDGNPAAAARDAQVVQKMQAEAKKHGATLANGGKGGLDPRLALRVFRRGRWRCGNKDCPTPKKNLTLDHISGHPKEIAQDPGARQRPDLRKGIALGHVDEPAALHVLCEDCHTGKGGVHARENQIEDGKRPDPMRGSA